MQTIKTTNQAEFNFTNSTKLVLTKKKTERTNEIRTCTNLFSPKILVFASNA